MQTTNVKNLDNKHSEWIKTLGFYKDELAIFNKRLTKVAEKNTSMEVMQMVEHFQNQFLVQAENIDILQHDINEHVSVLAGEILDHAGHINSDNETIHFVLLERVEKAASIFKEMKEEFMKFLSKTM